MAFVTTPVTKLDNLVANVLKAFVTVVPNALSGVRTPSNNVLPIGIRPLTAFTIVGRK